jgi:hypothetical protein
VELGRLPQSFCIGKGYWLCGGVGDSISRLSVDRRGDLGEDMMAAERVGGALVAEAWAHALSHRVWGDDIFLRVSHCMQIFRRKV